ncbi:S-layer homology domain-containing protein, partial [Pseudoflavonifractor sp. 60]|nr:S-layer homology domain-containing protein [Pseudoflavonifractor sp. 60]
AVENGILNGYSDGRLGPQGQATRAQVAQMLQNFMENQTE